jgi:hypothetical protein
MDTIRCDYCGELVVAQPNQARRAHTVTVTCSDCQTPWVFVYDNTGHCIEYHPQDE